MGMRKLGKRFSDWVDSFGEDAGDDMIVGAVIGALVVGGILILTGVCLSSGELVGVGSVMVMVHVGLVLVCS